MKSDMQKERPCLLEQIQGVSVQSIACTVPKQCMSLVEYAPDLVNEKTTRQITRVTGFSSLRITPKEMTVSDLFVKSAQLIMTDIDASDIGALVFVTEAPDYILPATSHVLQNRLNLPNSVLCLDINEGCSGYITGLYVASLLAKQSDSYVLFGGGGTSSKFTSPNDRATRCTFGDAGFACLITPDGSDELLFGFASHGELADTIIMENSRHRFVENPKNDGYLYIDGASMMKFTLTEVLEVIKQVLDESGYAKEEISLYACHQTNRLLLSSLAGALGIPEDKMPFTASEIGNTTSASIPLLLSAQKSKADLSRVFCLGEGVGLSVGICIANFSKTKIFDISEL